MSVFQMKYTHNGKKKQTKVWRVEFRDHNNIRRRVSGYRDKKGSEQLERIIEQLVACQRNGLLPEGDLVRAVEMMRANVRNRLVEWGVLDKRRQHAAKPLADHLDDYEAELVAKGASSKWARMVNTRARRVFDHAGCKSLSDLTANRVLIAADDLRQSSGQSIQTYNHTLAACKAFTKWAAPDRMQVDPLSKLKGRNAKANRVHNRRALTAGEARDLLAAAEAGPESWGAAGPERALIYRLAMETGLRANEIRTLTGNAFNLDGLQQSVTVEARHAKNRKSATLPLRPVLADLLRAHLQDKLPGALAFNMPASTHTAEMLRGDLAAAGVDYQTDQGFADFHALRHTFISNLARAGVMPNVAKELARHSTITLTMDYYTHTALGDNALAVAKLPDLDANQGKADTA